jgi:hypothetical protein
MPDEEIHEYIGWIPNVSGRLSFSEFGNTDNPTPCIRCSNNVDSRRAIIAYQKRHLSDTTVPIISCVKPLKKIFDYTVLAKEGVFWFCVTLSHTHSSTEDFLSGNVYIFYRDQWREFAESDVRASMEKLDESQDSVDALAVIQRLDESIKDKCSILTNFKIQRNGEIIVTFDEKAQGRQYISIKSDDIDDDIFSQVYYFLKDCLHKHHHHSRETDSILQLYQHDGKIDWKMETLYTLYRKIISRRRSGNIVDLNESLGVLAYASSFEKIFSVNSEAPGERPKYNRPEIQDSINSAIYSHENTKSSISLAIGDAWKATVTLGALLLSIFALISTSKDKFDASVDQKIRFLAQNMLENPIETTVLFFGILFIIFHFKNFRTTYRCIYDDTLRLLIAGRARTKLFFIAISISLYIITVVSIVK